MSDMTPQQSEFSLLVFTELNDHLRATDERSVILGGSYIAFVSAAAILLVDRNPPASYPSLILSLFVLLVGTLLLTLQWWYRAWKKHYLGVLFEIASRLQLQPELLPFWLRRPPQRRFSPDLILLLTTSAINALVLSYSLLITAGLLAWQLTTLFAATISSLLGYAVLLAVLIRSL